MTRSPSLLLLCLSLLALLSVQARANSVPSSLRASFARTTSSVENGAYVREEEQRRKLRKSKSQENNEAQENQEEEGKNEDEGDEESPAEDASENNEDENKEEAVSDQTQTENTEPKKFEDEKEKAKEKMQEDTTTEQDSTTDEEEDQTTETPPPLQFFEGAKNLTSNLAQNINATALSLSACEQIEMAVAFLTSLDFDQEFWQLANMTQGSTATTTATSRNLNGAKLWEVYLLQIILLPISLLMAFCGSNLLHPTCCLAAAGIGVFLVFHLVDFMSKSKSPLLFSLSLNLDCPMKLALSLISAFISAMLASTFLRFGLFSLGALAAGGVSYLIFDAFPFLDPTRQAIDYADATASSAEQVSLHGSNMDSELSPFGWILTTLISVLGGLFLRYYEQASLELVTAAMGGMGCAYAAHTFIILQGGQLNRSLVFLLANAIAFSGWRFQRHRRLYKMEYAHKKSEEERVPLVARQPPQYGYPAQSAQQQSTAASWNHLQSSINGLLQRSGSNASSPSSGGGPSQEQIVELTKSLNTLLTRMETDNNNGDGSGNKST